MRIEIERIDERSLGRLLYGTEAACVMAGDLFDVETFVQPAVEWSKRAVRGLLDGGGSGESEAVREKTEIALE